MKRLALSSFAYRYNIGFDGFSPAQPLTATEFIRRAHALGFHGVQLCENLRIAQMQDGELVKLRCLAQELGLFIEVGMNGANKLNLQTHLAIARSLGSSFLRVVLGGKSCKTADAIETARSRYIAEIRSILPLYKKANIRIGIENHFDLPTRALREIVDEINDEDAGLILDTTNCFHFFERPEETLGVFDGRIVSVHLKDYSAKKVEAGHFISGTILLDGELNIQPFLACSDNMVLEMTIRRPDGFTSEQILSWEDEAVAVSASRLVSITQA